MKELARRLTLAIYHIDQSYSRNEKYRRKSRAELNIMYALDDGLPHSQAELCRDWMVPKTTMNSIIRRWEQAGYVVQTKIPGKRREMEITLTESGRDHVRTSLDPIYRAEKTALEKTVGTYGDGFIDALQDFSEYIRAAFEEENTR